MSLLTDDILTIEHLYPPETLLSFFGTGTHQGNKFIFYNIFKIFTAPQWERHVMYLKSALKADSGSRRLVDIRFSRIEAFASPSNIFQIYFKYIWNIFQINFKSISNIFQIYSKYILNIFQIYLPHRCRCCSLAAPTPLQDANSPRPRRASWAADFADEVFGETVCVHEIRLFDFLYIKVRRIFLTAQSFYLILTEQSFKSQF